MKKQLRLFSLIALGTLLSSYATGGQRYNAIYSGTPWFDDRGKEVSAHGGAIIKDQGKYYLFGEAHVDMSNEFAGFNCYSSTDLYNWTFESVALPRQAEGKLGPNRVGERPKVMKSPSTGEYVMYIHVDDITYTDQFVGYATSTSIIGPYTFQGPLLFDGKPIRKWDMGTFQDTDGAGYVLLHGGDVYRLSDNYTSVVEHVNKAMTRGFESPALFRKDDTYYFLGSDLTGWERNDNSYYTATSLAGPWTAKGLFAPEGTLTRNSQTTFVLPVTGSEETTFMFMGDRWSFPRQTSAATYVWQPLRVENGTISLPHYHEAWQVNTKTGVSTPANIKGEIIANTDKRITYTGNWEHVADSLSYSLSGSKGSSFSFRFTGRQIAIYGLARSSGGYAEITLRDKKGNTVLASIVDMYCKYPVSTLKFLSPGLSKGTYHVTVEVRGERWYWKEKSGKLSGSSGDDVSFDRAIVVK